MIKSILKVFLKVNIVLFKLKWNKAIYFPLFPLVGLGVKEFDV